MSAAHDHPGFVLGFLKHGHVAGLGINSDSAVTSKIFLERRQGHDNPVILILAHERAALFSHPDYSKIITSDLNVLTQRRSKLNEIFHDIGPDCAGRHAVDFVAFVKGAPIFDLDIGNLEKIVGRSRNPDVLEIPRSVLDPPGPFDRAADVFAKDTSILDSPHVLDSDILALLGVNPILLRGDYALFIDNEGIGAE